MFSDKWEYDDWKKEVTQDSWMSDKYQCNCDNIADKSEKEICKFCGKVMCNMCKSLHGARHYYHRGFHPHNLCWKDDDTIVKDEIIVTASGVVKTGNSVLIDKATGYREVF
jgi:hypothetical protein